MPLSKTKPVTYGLDLASSQGYLSLTKFALSVFFLFFCLLFSAGCKYGIKYLILKNTCPQPSTHLDILHFSNHCPSNKILFVIFLHAQRQKWYFYSASIPLLEIIRINNPFADWLGISDLVPAMQVSAKMMQFIQSMAMSIMSHPFLFINECVDNLYVCGQYL